MAAALLSAAGQEASSSAPTFIEASATHQVTLEAETANFSLSLTLNTPQEIDTLTASAERALTQANASVDALRIEARYNYANQSFLDIFFSDYEPSDPPDFVNIGGTASGESLEALLVWSLEQGEVANLYQSGTAGEPTPDQLVYARQHAHQQAVQNATVLAAGMGCELGQLIEQRYRPLTNPSQTQSSISNEVVGNVQILQRNNQSLTATYTFEAKVTFEGACPGD